MCEFGRAPPTRSGKFSGQASSCIRGCHAWTAFPTVHPRFPKVLTTFECTCGRDAFGCSLAAKLWGECRSKSGALDDRARTSCPPTTSERSSPFTGQYTFAAALPAPNGKGLGLINYRARWYDSALGRFAQADTIVPGGVQGLDRYAYAANNPLRYTDPSGHDPSCTLLLDDQCVRWSDRRGEDQTVSKPRRPLLIFDTEGEQKWDQKEIDTFNNDAWQVATALGELMGIDPIDAFYEVYGGPVKVIWKNASCSQALGNDCGGWAFTRAKNEIWVFTDASTQDIINHPHLLAHELGHALENALSYRDEYGRLHKPGREALERLDEVFNRDGFYGGPYFWQLSRETTPGEIFADMFIGWAYDKWAQYPWGGYTPAGANKAAFMRVFMTIWLGYRTESSYGH